jgi:ribonuclease BN (tRNA processing enzyme)
LTRRSFVAASAALAASLMLPRAYAQDRAKTRLILLGTAGGPRPKPPRSAPAQAIIINNVLYVIDAGDGVARQLTIAGVPLQSLRHVFLTHHHSDHNAGYGNLLLLAWASGLRTRVDTWGPPPIARMTEQFMQLNATDIDIRIADEGRVPLLPLIHAHEYSEGGVVMSDENVKVTCALVDHPPLRPAFAYRFDSADRSIVISGDTNRSDNLVKLATGADVLVHEAMYVPGVDRVVGHIDNADRLKKHIIDSHTSVEDCGRIAAAAGVKTLVLSHLIPSDDPEVTDQVFIDTARPYFKGEIIVAKDLLEI